MRKLSKGAGWLVALAATMTLAPATAGAATGELPAATGETVAVEQTSGTSTSCMAPALSNPLAAFDDDRDYFLAPGGGFDVAGPDAWTLAGGATTVAGGGGLDLGAGDQRSLQLPPGGSAISPAFCVDLHYPSFRFFVAQLTDHGDGELKVDVIYPALEKKNVREAKKLKAHQPWELSDDVKLEPHRLGKQSGWRKVAIRFRAEGDLDKKIADWRIDDVLIDPRFRR